MMTRATPCFTDSYQESGYRNSPRNSQQRTFNIGFLLLENFSLPCFTQSLDALVTANLIRPGSVLVQTFSYTNSEVMSDLAIPIRPDTPLTEVRIAQLDLLLVCGGLRTPRSAPAWLICLLQKLAKLPITLGGLWNGAWYLSKAGLLDGYRCAIHAEQRIALAERSPNINVSLETRVLDRDRLTAATPAGAFQVMLDWLSKSCGKKLADAVQDLLNYDQSRFRSSLDTHHASVSKPLREIISLMESNLEEPLEPLQIADCVDLSLRQVQRLFRQQLGVTPQRHYLMLRLTEARRLIRNSSLSIVDVSLACGFASSSHFSRCYREQFGHPPSRETRHEL